VELPLLVELAVTVVLFCAVGGTVLVLFVVGVLLVPFEVGAAVL